MTPAVLTATFAPPPFSRREALRYAGCDADAGAALEALLDAAVKETWDKLTYRVCYARLPVTVRGDVCDFGAFACTSAGLAKNLSGCDAVILFAATVGAGIPATAEGRFAIAKKILAEAERYGIDKKDLLFDTLAMTVSADDHAALTTLAALRRIREELGCHTSLGVSNVSFGLPARDTVNSVFFALALENGLSAAIMNPYSDEMMRVYHTYRALKGLDANCLGYISAAAHFAAAAPAAQTAPAAQAGAVADGTALSPLQYAIVKGMRERAGEITRGDLADTPPLTLVNDEIIPALNRVGEGFEKKTVYLPQLLMSAEAAKSAFEVIKAAMPEGKRGDRATVVIATVEGDIHDIGKNIVKLLLENYGFAVVDLGRDVPPAKVADAVVERHAPLVGLSALMTTTVPAMEETIRLLRVRAPWCRVMVGGAVLTKAYAERIGADYYAKDAMESVRYAEETVKKAQTEKAKM